MISIKSRRFSVYTELAAFPDVLIDLHSMDELGLRSEGIKRLINKPDLDHSILVANRKHSLKDMANYFCFNAYTDMYRLFMMYTVIPVGSLQVMESRYYRSSYDDSLRTLRWVSAEHVCTEDGKVLFMQSPILLFDSSVSGSSPNDWFSAFVSLLDTGLIECIVIRARFCLGNFKIDPLGLLS